MYSECGGMMSTEQGMLASPNWPNSYGNNQNCSWTIVVTNGRTIRVTFNNNFNIDGTVSSCNGDYVQVWKRIYDSTVIWSLVVNCNQLSAY